MNKVAFLKDAMALVGSMAVIAVLVVVIVLVLMPQHQESRVVLQYAFDRSAMSDTIMLVQESNRAWLATIFSVFVGLLGVLLCASPLVVVVATLGVMLKVFRMWEGQ